MWGAGGTQRREVGSVLGLFLVEAKQAPSSPRLSHVPADGMAVAGLLSCGCALGGGGGVPCPSLCVQPRAILHIRHVWWCRGPWETVPNSDTGLETG